MLNLIRKDYPEMSSNDLNLIDAFIWNKCSEYYFIDYLRCTNGNAFDAIEFYKFDDDLRMALSQLIIRFEIQVKTDFVRKVYKVTKSESIYNDKKLYLSSSMIKRNSEIVSKYEKTVNKIESEYKKYKFKTPGPLNYVSLSFCSFGSFQLLYKYINNSYKKDFIEMYTRDFPTHEFKTLDSLLSSLKIIRNRCAHGNHIVTLKLKNQLSEKTSIIKAFKEIYPNIYLSICDCTILYLLKRSTCQIDLKIRLVKVLKKYEKIIQKYPGKHPFSRNIYKVLPHY